MKCGRAAVGVQYFNFAVYWSGEILSAEEYKDCLSLLAFVLWLPEAVRAIFVPVRSELSTWLALVFLLSATIHLNRMRQHSILGGSAICVYEMIEQRFVAGLPPRCKESFTPAYVRNCTNLFMHIVSLFRTQVKSHAVHSQMFCSFYVKEASARVRARARAALLRRFRRYRDSIISSY